MHVEAVEPLETDGGHSPLAAARVRRGLSREDAAARAGLTDQQAEWLEDGRLYRFPSGDDAVLAAMLYATALGIGRREARRIAGLPVRPRPLDWIGGSRLAAVLLCAVVLLTAVCVVLAVPRFREGGGSTAASKAPAKARKAALPAPWQISVDVLNGSGDIDYTRTVADRIGAMGYRIARVSKASRFDYPQTVVYYAPGGLAIAERLARRLGVGTQPLPGGDDARRLVAIVGPRHY